MKEMQDNSVDSIVTDPPYELGFMGKKWDSTGIAYNINVWKEALRVLKPGGYLLAFGGTRTYHRMACAIEDTGFEIRDQLQWIYGSGWPKSMNISKKIEGDYKYKLERQIVNTAEKSLSQYIGRTGMVGQDSVVELALPIVKNEGHIEFVNNAERSSILLNRTLLELTEDVKGVFVVSNVNHNGNNNLQVKIILIGVEENLRGQTDIFQLTSTENVDSSMILSLKKVLGGNSKNGNNVITLTELRMTIDLKIFNLLQYQNTLKSITTVNHTALKPASESIVVARKPLSERTVAANVLRWGTGGLNIDACRVGNETLCSHGGATKADNKIYGNGKGLPEVAKGSNVHQGRFPSNVILDEVTAKALDEQTGTLKSGKDCIRSKSGTFLEHGGLGKAGDKQVTYGDSGGASRFFYCAKASRKERDMGCKNTHPTVKPLKLMEYLVRLVTPPNGTVLDPFAGSGTTLIAAEKQGFNFVGFEKEKEYCEIAEKRLEAAQ